MSLEVQIHAAETHLFVKAVGQYSLVNLHDLFDRVKKESEDRANQKVILDVTEISGAIPVLDMVVLGKHCAQLWKHTFKVAIVSPVGGFTKFFENVARNRGLQLVVVPNQCAALEWLAT
jgi:hypothetical protein